MSFVRNVLSIIPRSMFMILNKIIEIQTNQLNELPTRVEKERLKEYAQLEERYELARATHAISVFTEGILAMESTLVGVIQVDPKKLLEDGIRKELVLQIATTMDRTLRFNTDRPAELTQNLNMLAAQLDGFRRSFQCTHSPVAGIAALHSLTHSPVLAAHHPQTFRTTSTFTASRSGRRSSRASSTLTSSKSATRSSRRRCTRGSRPTNRPPFRSRSSRRSTRRSTLSAASLVRSSTTPTSKRPSTSTKCRRGMMSVACTYPPPSLPSLTAGRAHSRHPLTHGSCAVR